MPSQVLPSAGRSSGAKRGNTNAGTFGHSAAEKALAKDQPFSALALRAQEEIESRISVDGLAAELTLRAVRIGAVADLMYEALCAKWGDMDIQQKMRLANNYSQMDARAVKVLKAANEMEGSRPDKQFPDIIEVS